MQVPRVCDAPSSIVSAVVSGPPGPRLLLFDFDGTLVEFGSVPGAVTLPVARRQRLDAIAARTDAVLGFVSGRRLDDLQSRIGVAGAWYAGLHGLEIAVPGQPMVRHPALDEFVPLALAVANRFASHIAWPGVWVEYKGPSVAVHWRDALPGDGAAARLAFAGVAASEGEGRLRLLDGDLVCEAVPDVPWDKGRALETMQAQLARQTGTPPWTLFAGDDWTDEHAFEALGDEGISVCVGDRPSIARFRLAGPVAVEQLLAALADAPRLSTGAVSRQV